MRNGSWTFRPTQALLFLLLLMNSQVFFVSVHNPIGLPMAQELYLAVLCVYVLVCTVPRWVLRGRVHTIDFSLFLVLFIASIGSATASWAYYGQPLYYGLVEDRRILGLLVYFPLADSFRSQRARPIDALRLVALTSVICAGIALLAKSGLVGDVATRQVSLQNLRGDRVNIGLFYYAIIYIYALLKARRARENIWTAVALLSFSLMFFVGQSRGPVLASLVITLLVIGRSFGRFLQYLLLASTAGLAGSFLFQDQWSHLMAKYADLFGQVSSLDQIAATARGQTITTIWTELTSSSFLPHGALSLLWNNGFHRLYGSGFFLADAGLFGTLFRYGFLAVPLLGAFIWIGLRAVRSVPPGIMRQLVAYAFLFLLLMSPSAGIIEYRGFVAGLILALAAGQAPQATTAHPSRSRRATV